MPGRGPRSFLPCDRGPRGCLCLLDAASQKGDEISHEQGDFGRLSKTFEVQGRGTRAEPRMWSPRVQV